MNEEEIINYLKYLDTFKDIESGYNLQRKISSRSLSSGQMQKIAFVRASAPRYGNISSR